MRRAATIVGFALLAAVVVLILFEVVFPWVDSLIDDPAVEPTGQAVATTARGW